LALAERERWPLWLPAGLASGIAIYFALPQEPSFVLGAGLGLAGVLLAATAMLSPETWLRVLLAALASVLIGFGMAKARTEAVSAPVLMHRLGPTVLEGRVVDAQVHGNGVRATLTMISADRLRGAPMPARVRLYFREGGDVLTPGEVVRAKAVLMPPPAPSSPNDYDFGRAAYFLRLGAVGYAYGAPQVLRMTAPATLPQRIAIAIENLRHKMTARIHTVLSGSTGAIAATLITGDRGGISEQDEASLRDAGLAHVLAIAGLHMALVGLGLFWAVRALLALIPSIALRWPIKKWAALAAVGGALFYLIISGASAATERAFIMLAMMLMAIVFDRPALSMRSVALAATVILLLAPESLIEPGFQMSFAAVIGLIAVAEWEQRRHALRETDPDLLPFPTVRRYMRGIAITSFVGSVATLPYAAFHFDRATHYAVLGNLGAMPIMGFVVMPSAAISVILMPFGLDRIPLHAMGWGIEAMLAVGHWVSGLPGAVSVVAAWPIWALIAVSAGGLWMGLWRGHWRWFGVAPVVAGVALAWFARPPDILVARDGVTIGMRGPDGALHLIGQPRDEYSATQWLKRDGDARAPQDAIGAPTSLARCDALGCITRAHGQTIATSFRMDALREDCATADIVISAVPTRGTCLGPKLVIDRFAIARNGAYAIWLGAAVRSQSAQEARGIRPWSEPPRWRRRFSSGE
ncbi:MAG: ComEC/Rec2 family competence protein, partial [Rhizomicrobium sp.]